MNDNRDEIQRLRAMRAEAVSRNDFARADAIGADLARPVSYTHLTLPTTERV